MYSSRYTTIKVKKKKKKSLLKFQILGHKQRKGEKRVARRKLELGDQRRSVNDSFAKMQQSRPLSRYRFSGKKEGKKRPNWLNRIKGNDVVTKIQLVFGETVIKNLDIDILNGAGRFSVRKMAGERERRLQWRSAFDRKSMAQCLLSERRKANDIAPLPNSSKSLRSWISLDFVIILNFQTFVNSNNFDLIFIDREIK